MCIWSYLVFPFCCCCWENGRCLVYYPVTRYLVKGMSPMFTGCDCHQCSQDATFCVYTYNQEWMAWLFLEMKWAASWREKLNCVFHDMTNKGAQSDQCICFSLTHISEDRFYLVVSQIKISTIRHKFQRILSLDNTERHEWDAAR